MVDLKSPDGADYLRREYVVNERSTYDIARELGVYSNLVLRALIYHGIERRTAEEAQVLALKKGRAQNPTKGKPRTSAEKRLISETAAQSIASMTHQERADMVRKSRESMKGKHPLLRAKSRRKAVEGLRQVQETGSRLERLVAAELRERGYKVSLHDDHQLLEVVTTIDLALTDLMVAMEFDGPHHHLDHWGEERLEKCRARDREKNGLLLEAGWTVIRIKSIYGRLSQVKGRRLVDEIEKIIKNPSQQLNLLEV